MPGRKLNTQNYSFGFNGQIQDSEWMGGQSVAFEFRTQDARLGRFLSTDPLTAMTPWETPYAFAANSPVALIDWLGLSAGEPSSGGVQRYGFWKKLGNWLKGKGYLNKANKYASENGIKESQIKEGKGKVTISEDKLTSPDSFDEAEEDGSYSYSLTVQETVFKRGGYGNAIAHTYEFSLGAGNTLTAANFGSEYMTSRDGNSSYDNAYRAGQVVGNVLGGLQATAELISGGTLMAGGGTITVGSFGALTVVGAPAVAAGGVLSAHGGFMWNNVWNNSMNMSGGRGNSPLGSGSGKSPYSGGKYGGMKGKKITGFEKYHMPADAVSPHSKYKGGAIQMDPADHALTASYRSSNAAKIYRAKQKKLIEAGDFKGAFEMDVRDIQRKFDNKYDKAISDLRKYYEDNGFW